MAWFKKTKNGNKKVKIPEGLWVKCNNCKEIVYRKEVERNLQVCPKCNYHFRINAKQRLNLLIDGGSFDEIGSEISTSDPLRFRDSRDYTERIKESVSKTGLSEAVITGEARLKGIPVVIAIMDFHFMGGSMGSVVGERITIAAEVALEKKLPLIICSSSGGARMQEGMFSLMQMAKVSAAIGRYKSSGRPYISVLTDPTFGGVSASFAMLGDIIIAEPKSLIGFAGPRVIEQTIKQQLPDDFQRAEFLLEHGLIDMVVDRKHLKETISRLLNLTK
ncbi:MAG TPA: acetyl-CoA carboxylase carboxyltransferase subunit beta [Nitrospirae bacterium]|nr:acetyl-CoA carboxylase carboxyltransferase subunit beta [Nitrospirota bacterium]